MKTRVLALLGALALVAGGIVGLATPAAAASAVTLGSLTTGTGVTGASAGATASVTGDMTATVTGTVTYTLYKGGGCTGAVVATADATVNADGSVPPFAPTSTLAAGPYSFGATFNGPDSSGNTTGSGCSSVISVGKATPVLATQVDVANSTNAWGASQPVGTEAQETATLSGVAGFAPTGTVTYSFYGDNNCSGASTSSTSQGSGVSSATVPLPNGTYSFLASYQGDPNYSSLPGTCQIFAVASGTGTVSFTNNVNDGTTGQSWATESTGATASQSVTVNGVGGITPTGTVTVSLYANGSCTAPAIQSWTIPLPSGSASVSSPASNPLAAGTYSYKDVYSGDSNYGANQPSLCSPTNGFTVAKGTPLVGSSVHDSGGGAWPTNPAPGTGAQASDAATVGQAAGVTAFTPTGTVTYNLFVVGAGQLPCTGSPSTTQTVSLSGGAVPDSNKTAALNKGGYAFQAVYSGDGNWIALTGVCESFNVALGTPSVSIGNLPGTSVEFGTYVAQVSTNGDGPTSVTSGTNAVCTVGPDGHTVSFVFYGTCTLTAVIGVGPNFGTATGSAQTISVSPAPRGYWLVGSDGGIFSFGAAQFHGSMGGTALQRPVVGITPTFDRNGYWLVASDGGVFAFGDSSFYGSLPGLGLHPAGSGVAHSLNAPVVGIVPSSTGHGYFMVASDGGVFAFGDAHFAGSCPGIGGCAGTAVAVLPDHSGNGYWLVTSSGSVYAFGDAGYYGASTPFGVAATDAIATPDGHGYWILYANGTVLPFGDASSLGAPLGYVNQYNPAEAIFTTQDGHGYWVTSTRGDVFSYGNAPFLGGMAATNLNGAIIAAFGF